MVRVGALPYPLPPLLTNPFQKQITLTACRHTDELCVPSISIAWLFKIRSMHETVLSSTFLIYILVMRVQLFN